MDIRILQATISDISAMVDLSYLKRRNYEKAQSKFWRYQEGAEYAQSEWFQQLLMDINYIMLIAKSGEEIIGFIIGKIMPAPMVYDPGGLTLMIDDFCVKEDKWSEIGTPLIEKIKKISKEKGARQLVVVSGDHDIDKCRFLDQAGLSVASRWYVGEIDSDPPVKRFGEKLEEEL